MVDSAWAAVIVGMSITGLGLVRSLAPHGIPCYILYNEADDPCLATRYGRKICVNGLSATDVLPELRRLHGMLGHKPVLFLTNDSSVEGFSEARDDLQRHVRMALPPHDTVRALINKSLCRDLYDRAGIDQPANLQIASGPVDPEGLAAFHYPCIIKAAEKSEAYFEHCEKAYIVENPAEARDRIQFLFQHVPEVVIQEWVGGKDSDIYFCFAVFGPDSCMEAHFVGRKVISYPPRTGTGALCVPATEHAETVRDLTERFFKAADYIGIGSMEVKRDPASGRFMAIEPTAVRVDANLEMATLNGCNLPLIHYCLETDQAPPPVHETPRAWYDSRSMAHLSRRVAPLADGLPRRDAYFRFRDPGPMIRLQRGRIQQLGRRLGLLRGL